MNLNGIGVIVTNRVKSDTKQAL